MLQEVDSMQTGLRQLRIIEQRILKQASDFLQNVLDSKLQA